MGAVLEKSAVLGEIFCGAATVSQNSYMEKKVKHENEKKGFLDSYSIEDEQHRYAKGKDEKDKTLLVIVNQSLQLGNECFKPAMVEG